MSQNTYMSIVKFVTFSANVDHAQSIILTFIEYHVSTFRSLSFVSSSFLIFLSLLLTNVINTYFKLTHSENTIHLINP